MVLCSRSRLVTKLLIHPTECWVVVIVLKPKKFIGLYHMDINIGIVLY